LQSYHPKKHGVRQLTILVFLGDLVTLVARFI